MSIKDDLVEPYWFTDSLVSLDFNKEVVEHSEIFPDGAVGIRVDDDFWAVAVLPLKYRDTPIETIVVELWPEYLAEAEFCPDSGTHEQEIYFKNVELENEKSLRIATEKKLEIAMAELERLRSERPGLTKPKSYSRIHKTAKYWIDQYEHLLSATAHEFVENDDSANSAVCSSCGLLKTDRVHNAKYIGREHDPWFPGTSYWNKDGS